MARMFLRRIAIFTISAVAIVNRFRRGQGILIFFSLARASGFSQMEIDRGSFVCMCVDRATRGQEGRLSRTGESVWCCNNTRVRCNICLLLLLLLLQHTVCAHVRERKIARSAPYATMTSSSLTMSFLSRSLLRLTRRYLSCNINHAYRILAWLIRPGKEIVTRVGWRATRG